MLICLPFVLLVPTGKKLRIKENHGADSKGKVEENEPGISFAAC